MPLNRKCWTTVREASWQDRRRRMCVPRAPGRRTASRDSENHVVTPHHRRLEHRPDSPTTISCNPISEFDKNVGAVGALGARSSFLCPADTSSRDTIRQPPYPSARPRQSPELKGAEVQQVCKGHKGMGEACLLRPAFETSSTDAIRQPPYHTISASSKQEVSSIASRPSRRCGLDSALVCLPSYNCASLSPLRLTASGTSSLDSTQFTNHHIIHSDVDLGETGLSVLSKPTFTRFATHAYQAFVIPSTRIQDGNGGREGGREERLQTARRYRGQQAAAAFLRRTTP
ncbi:hypothetical protein CVT26_015422 [Gymnopilus dilepis]|uniref:Uncharacterized protein n=1 Tax=Gymnopilus dilepis TaxID=231916 RepID=A0A409YEE2_9AGAR|nr:hypothetical protein CVT26_015422 [Gymnopilus dilepis]